MSGAGSPSRGLADGERRAASPVLRAADPGWPLTADVTGDVTGAEQVEPVVEDGGDGNGNDHADRGAARFRCSG
ncbi:NPCBM/NEW2 domain-containing protein [Streptomyces sp. NPDC005805]|uniref:NPCBM/NEW2 domain-containing protein n=1 Tax=Streptomyces sp. NPDC005805 TaxID=3157068 RepID=UPI0033DBCEB4